MAMPFITNIRVQHLSYGNIHEGPENEQNKTYNLNDVGNNSIDSFPRTAI